MKIGELILILDNRLREFKLSRDYARMSGDLERLNAADKEIIGLTDTLYQLNLLVDASKSATVKKSTLAEVITDGSTAVLSEYDITPYATDPLHEEKIMNILSKMGVMDTAEKIDEYIKDKYLSSPVTGEMIMSAALAYEVDARLMMAIMEQDSRFGTVGMAVRTLNPGNVGNDDGGNTRTYDSWQEGVTAVAEWLNRHRVSKIVSEVPEEAVLEPTATSTPAITTSTTTTITTTSSTTPITATSTPTTATSTPITATTTPATTTSTTTTATTTPVTATSTPTTATSTPITATTTPATTTSTTTTATTTPVTATSTPTTAISTPITATTTPATFISTSTPTTAASSTTPVTATSTPVTTTLTTTTATATSTSSPQTNPQATTTQETAATTAN